jgi:lipopolysaccharide/colanic/teichoic acid biosynthesis glycosyltransferase
VGRRPPFPRYVERYEDWHFGRLRIRRGMTGLRQINGRREIPFIQMVRVDVYHAEERAERALWRVVRELVRSVHADR